MSAGGFAAYRPLLASTSTVTVGPDAATGDPLWHAAGREQIPTPRRRMTGVDDGRGWRVQMADAAPSGPSDAPNRQCAWPLWR